MNGGFIGEEATACDLIYREESHGALTRAKKIQVSQDQDWSGINNESNPKGKEESTQKRRKKHHQIKIRKMHRLLLKSQKNSL